jgi:hypothetical protein
MSIQDDAHKFYKRIWDSPNREEIQTVVEKLKSSKRGYGNKVSPAPMLGLLLYNQQQLKRLAGRTAVEELASWSERELKILFGVHNQVRHFNQQCLAPLMAALPESINAVNPYKEYPQTVPTEGFEELLFKQEDAEEVIHSFHTHPAFTTAISNLSSVKDRQANYDRTIRQFNSQIVEAGPGGEPKWFTEYEQARRAEHPDVGIFRHVAGLICLHDSLANLDQFIYHGLFQDELIQINRNHVIDYMWTTRGVGPSMWLMHIPYGYMYIFEPTDLIIVNTDKPGETGGLGDTLCRIEAQTLPMDMSTPGVLKMRMIDENLNAYRYLIR